jgi:hypothetical protein
MSVKFRIILFLFTTILTTACSKKDTTFPVISLKGDALVVVTLNTHYSDAGATATDDLDGVLTVETDGSVDTNFAGIYYIIYSATDAAGNQANATRTVVVRNEAEIYNGNYNTMTLTGIDTSYYTASSTISSTLNKRIWLVGYSDVPTAAVYADLRRDTITVPVQMVNAGTPLLLHSFSGSGFIKTISDHTVFEISFTDSVGVNIYNGTSVYTKTD